MSQAAAAPSAEFRDIAFEVRDKVGIITLDRPDKLNAWTAAMEQSIREALGQCARDENIRAVVITGAGRGFCAGADMELLQGIKPDAAGADGVFAEERETLEWDTTLGPDLAPHLNGRFGYMPQVPKPIIAAVNGPCAGLGMVFTLWCDIRFAGNSTFFTTAFAKRGLIAEHGISWLLPELVGPAASMDLLFSARRCGAEEALRLGLVNSVSSDDTLLGDAIAYARDLAETASPRSIAVMKAQVWKAKFQNLVQAMETGDQEMNRSFSSEDFKEGVAHFVEKRAPKFTGR